MNEILEALGSLLPKDQLNEVNAAVEKYLSEAEKQIEAKANAMLEEAYAELSAELAQAEKIAEQGYMEAYQMICDLRNRMETMREEFEATLEENYEDAYQIILSERAKNSNLEVEMYDEYDSKFSDMKEFVVDKLDEFLQYKGAEIYEQAKRDILNDPRYAEHKVALDKIVEIASDYLSEEEMSFATSARLEQTQRKLEELQATVKMMEARNIKLSHDNTRLNEQVRHASELLTEARGTERTERVRKARGVQGRGHGALNEDTRILNEYQNNERRQRTDDDEDEDLMEGVDLKTLRVLSGVDKTR
jgi:predicted transcriptional regulator